MTTDPTDPGFDAQAAELALGVLEGEERAAALRRQLKDPDFAREVERWSDHFATLFASVPDAEVPAALEQRVLGPRGANDDSRPWKWATGLSGGLAAALALMLATRDPAPPPIAPPPTERPMMVAALAPAGEGKPMALMVDRMGGTMSMAGGMDVPSGHDAQLWLIEQGGSPQPLGLLKRSQDRMVASVTVGRPIPAGATIAVSIEPVGGSPTGLPTGPVVASGTVDPV